MVTHHKSCWSLRGFSKSGKQRVQFHLKLVHAMYSHVRYIFFPWKIHDDYGQPIVTGALFLSPADGSFAQASSSLSSFGLADGVGGWADRVTRPRTESVAVGSGGHGVAEKKAKT